MSDLLVGADMGKETPTSCAPRQVDWLALCLRTESELEHEFAALAWVVRNRVESPRYPDSYVRVIRQAWQFSAFNDYRILSDEDCWRAMTEDASRYWRDWQRALPAAEAVMSAPRSPFDNPRVTTFWSPRSMEPKGSDPKWAVHLVGIRTLPGIDPQRFRFGEERA